MTPAADPPIEIQPWDTEDFLFALCILVGIVGWIVLAVTIIGLVYALFLAVFFGIMHVVFIAHVRGSAVRLGPNQFPELFAVVERMAARMRLEPMPEVYLMQAGGSLNAFATRFLRSHMVVLFSDLLDACGENTAARDMIIAHELGHIKAGHLRWRWLILPSGFIPFLPAALSRAREYTCDRYGLAGTNNDREGAGLGLAILAAGATHGPKVNRAELVRQRLTISRSGWMTFAEWFGSHPPLCKRIAQIDPSLAADMPAPRTGFAKAFAFTMAVPVSFVFLTFMFLDSDFVQKFRTMADSARTASVQQAGTEEEEYVPPPDAAARARADITRLAAFLELERRRGSLPWNGTDLYRRLESQYPAGELPTDPFDDSYYGYAQSGRDFVIWSSGADGRSWTEDDIRFDSRIGKLEEPAMPRLPLP